jgi:hypothetical protein
MFSSGVLERVVVASGSGGVNVQGYGGGVMVLVLGGWVTPSLLVWGRLLVMLKVGGRMLGVMWCVARAPVRVPVPVRVSRTVMCHTSMVVMVMTGMVSVVVWMVLCQPLVPAYATSSEVS